MRRRANQRRLALALLVLCSTWVPARAITIRIDYTYDNSSNRFFSTGNPQGAAAGAQAKSALDAAASYFSTILTDSFSAITVPPKYFSEVSDGMVSWEWTRSFSRPDTGNLSTITHNTAGTTVAANEYVVYAGARNLSGNTLGVGGVGGCGSMSAGIPCWRNHPSGSFSPLELAEAESIENTFKNQVERRNQSSGFVRWGGSVAFDRTPPQPWHYSHTTAPTGNVTDFYSVALHELAHALGFGEFSSSTVTEWDADVSGTSFDGQNASALYGGPVPLNAPDLSHWAQGTQSVVFGGTTPQEAAMDPDQTTGTRKRFTALDAAAMKDIGWSVVAPPGVNGDYNNNGVVDAADYVVWRKRLGQNVTIPNDATPGTVRSSDYTVWRTNFGDSAFGGAGAAVGVVPEPGGAGLAVLGSVVMVFARRKRRG